MNWIEKFYDLLEENRVRHNLLSHMKSNSKETMIEVHSGKDLIIHITDEDYDNCFKKAYDDLELKIKWMNAGVLLAKLMIKTNQRKKEK